jgi:phosphomethylpyrimidine synthase
MTQLDYAKRRIVTDEMKQIAEYERMRPEKICADIRNGKTVAVKHQSSNRAPLGIGKDLRIKINANIGTSPLCFNISLELEKLSAAVKYGADTVMDLSTGGDIRTMRKKINGSSTIPVGTVPIYEVITKNPDVATITGDDFLSSIEKHISDGIDFITVHCGVRREHISLLGPRIMGVVSRGGSFLIKWMLHHGTENPLFTHYDRILEFAKKYDVVLSLGDGLRPGCIHDATDKAQIAELKTLAGLSRRAQRAGVQVMIEGPGHVPLHQVEQNVKLQKRLCRGAPFYVLGPLVTDISPGYDHITGAIGGALAASYGADFLCYLTPKEHLGLPNLSDVIDGVIASKIAAHAADIARGIKNADEADRQMATARSKLDWDKMLSLALNPDKARAMRTETIKDGANICSMCGEFCSAKTNLEMSKLYKNDGLL